MIINIIKNKNRKYIPSICVPLKRKAVYPFLKIDESNTLPDSLVVLRSNHSIFSTYPTVHIV